MTQQTNKPRRIIRLPELLVRTGIARSTAYDKLNPKSPRYDPDFPRPFKLGGAHSSAIGWSEEQVDAWICMRMAS